MGKKEMEEEEEDEEGHILSHTPKLNPVNQIPVLLVGSGFDEIPNLRVGRGQRPAVRVVDYGELVEGEGAI